MLLDTPVNSLMEQVRSAAPDVVLGAALPVLAAGAAWVLKFVKQRNKKKEQQKDPKIRKRSDGEDGPRELDGRHLRRAWRRFLARLPKDYARALPNWEYFVVLGTDTSGKDALIDTMIDWPHYMRQLGDRSPPDPELPVFMGPGALVVDLPWRYWQDGGTRSRESITALWKWLFRYRGPTVVVAVSRDWLREATGEELVQFAELAREQIDRIATIRRKAIEVRVAITHMGDAPGFSAAARFWSMEQIANKLGMHVDDTAVAIRDWEQEMVAQLPRALGELSADEYRQYVDFLRDREVWLEPLHKLVDALFAKDIMSEMPVRGGVYLCSDREMANPLKYAAEGGPGRDVRRKHLAAAIAAAAVGVAYLAGAFGAQHSWMVAARQASKSYSAQPQREKENRETICEFTLGRGHLLFTRPWFFDASRSRVRAELSGMIRIRMEDQLKAMTASHNSNLRWRRAIYYLGVLHSDRADLHRDGTLMGVELALWTKMTGLGPAYISDFVENTEKASSEPVSFGFAYEKGYDPRDTLDYWKKLPRAMREAVSNGLLSRKELMDIAATGEQMKEDLSRFEDDLTTLSILQGVGSKFEAHAVSSAAGPSLGGGATSGGQAASGDNWKFGGAYSAEFRPCIQDLPSRDSMKSSVESMRQVLEEIHRATLDVDLPQKPLLGDLADRLAAELDLGKVCPRRCDPIPFKFGDDDVSVDRKQWREVVRSSRIGELVRSFLARADADGVFFSSDIEAGLRAAVWNPVVGNDFIFGGANLLHGKYTKSTFDEHVRAPILYLSSVLGALEGGDTRSQLTGVRRDLEAFVTNAIELYANAYRKEMTSFLQGFTLQVRSPEELRLALDQIASDESMFDAFLRILDRNSDLHGATDPGQAAPKAARTGDASRADGGAPEPDEAEREPKGAAADGGLLSRTAVRRVDEPWASRVLEPMDRALAMFAPFHAFVNSPRFRDYKQVARNLEKELGAATSAQEKGKQGAEGADAKLEDELTPVGQRFLVGIGDGKSSYRNLAAQSVAGLSPGLQAPFLAPFDKLGFLGLRSVDDTVKRVWREMCTPVQELTSKAPFSQTAAEWATPEEIAELLHPIDGKFSRMYRNYIEPLSAVSEGRPFAPLPALEGLSAADLFETSKAIKLMASRLWDDKGKPKAIEVELRSVPFESRRAAKAPTVVALGVGATTIQNYNQKPFTKTLFVDWAKPDPAQLRVVMTDIATRDTSVPMLVESEAFSFFRLLRAAVSQRIRDGIRYEWRVPVDTEEKLAVQFDAVGSPWQAFKIPHPIRCPKGRP